MTFLIYFYYIEMTIFVKNIEKSIPSYFCLSELNSLGLIWLLNGLNKIILFVILIIIMSFRLIFLIFSSNSHNHLHFYLPHSK